MKTHISSPAALSQDVFLRTSYIGLNAKHFSYLGQDTVYQAPLVVLGEDNPPDQKSLSQAKHKSSECAVLFWGSLCLLLHISDFKHTQFTTNGII